MNFFEIMKYFARAIEQMRAVDGILIPQFPWPLRRAKQNTVAPPRQGSKLHAATPRTNLISRRRSSRFTTWNAPWHAQCKSGDTYT